MMVKSMPICTAAFLVGLALFLSFEVPAEAASINELNLLPSEGKGRVQYIGANITQLVDKNYEIDQDAPPMAVMVPATVRLEEVSTKDGNKTALHVDIKETTTTTTTKAPVIQPEVNGAITIQGSLGLVITLVITLTLALCTENKRMVL